MGSGWTLGGVRQSGRDPAELPLAKASVQRWPTLGEELEADVQYRQRGNLRLARTREEGERIAAVVRTTRAAGIEIEFLPDADAIRRLAPAFSSSLVAASYCPTDGHANPIETVRAYAAAAKRLGASIETGFEVNAIVATGGRITGVLTAGEEISCDTVVLAAGVYTPSLLNPLGITLPITIRVTPVIQSVPVAPVLDQVLGVATGDLAARQEVGGRLRLSGGGARWSAGLGAIAESNDAIQPTLSGLSEVLGRATAILPAFADMPVRAVWGGLIDQTPDGLPVYSRESGADELVIGAGFSGHGFGIGPVTGQILSQLAIDGHSSYHIEPFRIDRFGPGVEGTAAELFG
jgi:sarcosine oxidase, subunit beta